MRSPPATHRLYVVEAAGWTSRVTASDAARAAFDGLRALSHKPAERPSRWGKGKAAEPRAFNAKADRLSLDLRVRTATAHEAAEYIVKNEVVVRVNSRLAKQAAEAIAKGAA